MNPALLTLDSEQVGDVQLALSKTLEAIYALPAGSLDADSERLFSLYTSQIREAIRRASQ